MKSTLSICKGLIAFLAIIISNTLSVNAQTVLADVIPTSYDVSSTGAFTYTLPLRIPPGVRDMVPNLSITYSSQNGNSVLGMGWTLSGLSSITRANTTIFHNNDIQAPSVLLNEFLLDGQRLIKDTTNTSYNTEVKNFAEIISIGNVGLGPDHFTVAYPSGVTYEYGNTIDSRLIAQLYSPSIVTWAVNRIYDANGNYITFEYYNGGQGELRITKITYGGNLNAGTTHNNEIVFNYQARTDVNKNWMLGTYITDNVLLSSIDVKHKGNVINTYEFTYDVEIYTRLKQINEKRPLADLPPITINWGKEDDITYNFEKDEIVVTNPLAPASTNTFAYAGDYNGDGMTDIIEVPYWVSNNDNFHLYVNDKNNGFTYKNTEHVRFTSSNPNGSFIKTHSKPGRMFFDYNADGNEDLIVRINDGSSSSSQRVILQYFNSDGNQLNYVHNIYEDYMNGNPDWMGNVHTLPGDFDGDGVKEIVILVPVQMNNAYVQEYNVLIVGENYPGQNGYPQLVGKIYDPCHAVYAMDYDGDGKDEIWRTQNNSLAYFQVYKINFNYNNASLPYATLANPGNSLSLYNSSTFPTHEHFSWDGDFNGDGKKDLLTWLPNDPQNLAAGGTWNLAYAKGNFGIINSFDVLPLPSNMASIMFNAGPGLPTNYGYFIGDFNGDGKDDILQRYNLGLTSDYDVFYSNGYNSFIHDNGDWPFNIFNDGVQQGDFNGDGQIDFFGRTNGYIIFYLRKNDIQHLVTSVEHFGQKVQIEHLPLTQDADYRYGYYGPVVYPKQAFNAPFKVTKTVKDNINIDNKYIYKDGIVELNGLGFKGFAETHTHNLIGKRYTANYYKWNSRLHLLDNTSTGSIEEISPGNWAELLSTARMESYNYHTVSAGGVSVINVPIEKKINDAPECTATRFEYIYDNNRLLDIGQPDEVIEHKAHATPQEYTVTQRFTYDPSATFINKPNPVHIEIESIRPGSVPYFRTQDMTYNNSGQVETQVIDPGLPEAKTINLLYDVFGNLENSDISAVGTSNIVDAYEYTLDGRFMSSHQNPLGYTEEFTYNLWGSTRMHKSFNTLVTRYEYDPVNRVSRTILPTGAYTTNQYSYAVGGTDAPLFQQPRLLVTIAANGILGDTKLFYDHYGNLLRKASTAFDGQTIYEDIKYTPNNQTEYITTPYFSSDPSGAATTTYEYDNGLREILRTNSAGGPTIEKLYAPVMYPHTNSLYMTVNNLSTGQKKDVIYNAAGELKDVYRYMGPLQASWVRYTYHSNGQPDQVKVNSTITTSYQYDPLGNNNAVNDHSTGSSSGTYNALGQVVTETDANNITYTYTYDLLGRVVQKIGPDGTHTYAFDNTPGTATTGKMLFSTTPYGTNFTYEYDNMGRLIKLTEGVNGQQFISRYSYDIYDREITHTYPTGDVIRNLYNIYGYLYKINLEIGANGLPAQTLWQINAKNNLGQITEAEYYDVLSSPIYKLEKSFSLLGLPVGSKVTNNISTNAVVDVSYDFDHTTSNLSLRTDNIRGFDETFTYDEFDQLLTVNNTAGAPGLTMEYDYVGNILKKSDVSASTYNWKYDKFQLKQIPEPQTSSPAYTIPIFTQNVSYHPFNKVKHIFEEPDKDMEFIYGPDEQRSMTQYTVNNAAIEDKYYASDYEKVLRYPAGGGIREMAYVYANDQLIAILSHDVAIGVSKVNYIITDYLGSITHVLDNHGVVNDGLLEERSYSAWGRYRDPNTWQYLTTAPAYMFDRGYTGHEHLNQFNIINMDGRLYDPLAGRMFNADPVIADELDPQSYNSYSYAVNNPLKYTDPDGECHILIGAAIGGLFNLGSQLFSGQINSIGDAAKAFGVGAVAGGAAAATGGAVSGIVGGGVLGGAATGGTAGFVGGFLNGGGNAWAAGANFNSGISSALKAGGLGALSGAAMGGIAGGLEALNSNKNLWTSVNAVPTTTGSIPVDMGTDPSGYGMHASVAGDPTLVLRPIEVTLEEVAVSASKYAGRTANILRPLASTIGRAVSSSLGATFILALMPAPLAAPAFESSEAFRARSARDIEMHFAKAKKDYGSAGGAEHTKGASKRKLNKHQGGIARKVSDRGGAKGMKYFPRRRPANWSGGWPPK